MIPPVTRFHAIAVFALATLLASIAAGDKLFANEPPLPATEPPDKTSNAQTPSEPLRRGRARLDEQFYVGSVMQRMGYRNKYPLVIIPGLLSTSLEVWNAGPEMLECAQRLFRQRIYGDMNIVYMLLFHRSCWLEHMMLNETTGTDRSGTKVRPAQGLPAGDYLLPRLWVFAPLYASLAAIGYDTDQIHFAGYDWRLEPRMLEARDRYFTRLQQTIEVMRVQRGLPVVLLSHSMGSLLTLWFFRWLCRNGKAAGVAWLDSHVHRWISVAAPMLGSVTAPAMLLSGDRKDLVNLNSVSSYLAEQILTRAERQMVARSWSSVAFLVPRGGTALWGSPEQSPPDATPANRDIMGAMFSIRQPNGSVWNLSSSDVIDLLRIEGGPRVRDVLENSVDPRFLRTEPELEAVWQVESSWGSPLTTALPPTRNLRIYFMYGINAATERKLFMRTTSQIKVRVFNHTRQAPLFGFQPRDWNDFAPTRRLRSRGLLSWLHGKATDAPLEYTLDSSITDRNASIYRGVLVSDGDDAVPLLSLGFVGRHLWNRRGPHNPADVPTITREYYHEPRATRRGRYKATHVGILGHYMFLQDVIRIVSGHEDAAPMRGNVDIPTRYSPPPRAGDSSDAALEAEVVPFGSSIFLGNRIYSAIDQWFPSADPAV